MKELKEKFLSLKQKFTQITKTLNQDKLSQELRELEAKTLKSDFWSDVQKAQVVMQEIGEKRNELEAVQNLEQSVETISGLLTLSEEDLRNLDVEKEIISLEKDIDKVETRLYLSGKFDKSNAVISVHAGQGGVEAMDWAAMLFRMYQRFCEKKGWKTSLINETRGEEAGIKSATIEIEGPFAYGMLRSESGTHRLVRLSPFNADNLRQTSFALVEVLPVIDDAKEIDLNQKDLEIETFHSSGPGGQNVQKVSTAVRIKHIPTGISVSCQSERSQYQNKENALKILTGKVFLLQEEARKKSEAKLKNWGKTASWGTQIRSYVLHPYKMVKDNRTGYETTNAESVLDGEIDTFLEKQIRI